MGVGLTPMRFWRELTTDALLEKLSSTASDTILNLLPKDAAACIDMKRLSASATIITPDFKIQKSGGLATPQAGLLKAWRGQLLREIIKGDISSPAALKEIETYFIRLLSRRLIPHQLPLHRRIMRPRKYRLLSNRIYKHREA